MEILMKEEKEKYFLELAKEGDNLPWKYYMETIVVNKEETLTSTLKKNLNLCKNNCDK